VPQAWTVTDGEGHALPCFTGASRLDVERKVVATHYDAFRLLVSSSYRELFAREVAKVLAHKGWRIARTRRPGATAQLELKLN
jgi:hypothetical protein